MDKLDTGLRSAVLDIAKNLTTVFKKYSRNTRTKAWKKLTSDQGSREMGKLLQDPNRSLNMFPQIWFKEWLESQETKD